MSPRHHRVKPALTVAASAAVLALGLLPGPVGAVVPAAGGAFLDVEIVSINVGPTDAYYPRLSGDLVTYTASTQVRYYDLFTGTDVAIPTPPGATDVLSSISDGRIAYSRIEGSGWSALVHEVATGSTTTVGSSLGFPIVAIGSTTVAFTPILPGNNAEELVISVLGGATTQITSDSRWDVMPEVSPDGQRVVWESCYNGAVYVTSCDIREATWDGTSWVVAELTSNDLPEGNPDSDGVVTVYEKPVDVADPFYEDFDVCWQPAGGGSETCLEISGMQMDPSISDGIISFPSSAPDVGIADVWLYRIADNSLYQVTNTPWNEALTDVLVLPDGRVRVAWSSGDGERDIYAATITMPPVGPSYAFGGLLAPVDPLPTLNSMKAGAAVPVKFSLGGSFGLEVFAADYPKSQAVACDSTAPVDGVEQTLSAGGSGLSYDAASGLYTYVWKTEKSWAGTCRQLVLTFADGTVARANFKLK